MVEISEVPGITGSTLELFRAAGIGSVEILIANDVPKIMAALDRANAAYDVAVRPPSEDLVRAWQNAGRTVLRKRAESSPSAKVVPTENLRAAGIDVTAVPVAKVVEVPPPKPTSVVEPGKVETPAPQPPAPPESVETKAGPAGSTAEATNPPGENSLTKKAAARKSTAKKATSKETAAMETTTKKAGAQKKATKKAVSQKNTASGAQLPAQSINTPPSRRLEEAAAKIVEEEVAAKKFRELEKVKDEKEQGQRRNRGMSHPDATRVRWAATVTVLAPLVSLVAAGILIWALVRAQFYGDHFHPTIALFLLVFPAALMFYLGIGAKPRCRLCGQKLFVPKHCRKHERASRSIFGYTFAVARNAMLFANYRCMLCGTKTRLKD